MFKACKNLPFLCLNRQIWSNSNTLKLFFGKTGGGGNSPFAPWDAASVSTPHQSVLQVHVGDLVGLFTTQLRINSSMVGRGTFPINYTKCTNYFSMIVVLGCTSLAQLKYRLVSVFKLLNFLVNSDQHKRENESHQAGRQEG